MKKLFLFIWLVTLSTNAIAQIDECKVDLYYANGVMMQDTEAQAQDRWGERVDDLFAKYPQLKNRLGKTDVAYNISEGMVADMWESFNQKVGLEPAYNTGWSGFKLIISRLPAVGKAASYMIKAGEIANEKAHDGTLRQQMDKYKESIKAGHGVIAVAHSQGNLFTIEAFKELDPWMKPYFHMISVATPASEVANGGQSITFYNDMVKIVPGAMDEINNNMSNPNKHDYIKVTRNALGEIIDRELFADQKSVQYHGFEYYLGYSTYEKALVEGSTTITRTEKRETDDAKDIIMQWLYDEIIAHEPRDSQWETNEEFEKDTCDYKITVKHRHDPDNITLDDIDTMVYPFAPNKKLYQVNGEWVKASCGGDEIYGNDHNETEWDGKKTMSAI